MSACKELIFWQMSRFISRRKVAVRIAGRIKDQIAARIMIKGSNLIAKMCIRDRTREDVAENFSRTAPTWGWVALDKPDWEFWNEELKETRVWNEEDFRTYKREVFKKDIIQSVYFLPVLWVLKFVDNYYIPVILMGITVFIYCSSYADKWASRIKDLTKEYQRAALRQLIDEKQKVYIKTESIEE